MIDSDRHAFGELLAATMQVYRANLGAAAIGIWWAALERYPLATVRAALSAHVKESKFAPAPAEIIKQIAERDGRPGPEEAWAIVAPTIGNEAITIVWTPEMAQAWGVARELEGDRVASRMAFLEQYRLLVQRARESGAAVEWTPCLGYDVGGREAPLIDAAQKGRLTHKHVAGLLPHHEQLPPAVAQPIKQKRLTA